MCCLSPLLGDRDEAGATLGGGLLWQRSLVSTEGRLGFLTGKPSLSRCLWEILDDDGKEFSQLGDKKLVWGKEKRWWMETNISIQNYSPQMGRERLVPVKEPQHQVDIFLSSILLSVLPFSFFSPLSLPISFLQWSKKSDYPEGSKNEPVEKELLERPERKRV